MWGTFEVRSLVDLMPWRIVVEKEDVFCSRQNNLVLSRVLTTLTHSDCDSREWGGGDEKGV